MALITLENFTFTYALADRPALEEINLNIDRGEFLLLCGPSGCGKTTLLRHMKQELTPAGDRSGSFLYDGIPVGKLPAARSACEVGLVMQDPDSQIVTEFVVNELAFGLENLGFDSGVIRRRVAEMASFFGIGHWLHKKTGELSGGQKQMLNLAAILVMQPKLLLLDEPTSMLDPVASRTFVEMAGRLNREFGITVVMAGHRLEEVFHLASRVAFMEKGRISYLGAPEKIGGFLDDNPHAICFMPAAVRIAAQLGDSLRGQLPMTVNDGKTYLTSLPGIKMAAVKHPTVAAGQPGKPAIACKNLWFRYEKNAPDILRELSLQAYPGEINCILGENGSGKSTLLGLLGGLLKPLRGSVFAGGENLAKLGSRARYLNNIALLPQSPKALFVCENLLDDLKASAQAAGESDSQISMVAESLGLTALLVRHPYDLSGGEMKRAALAKLLLTNPKILLLDEPTSGMDAAASATFAQILRGLCKKSVCVVIITHDIEFAVEYADRCMLLFDGEIACAGSPREFFGGNCFYTTAANRIAREIDPFAITCGDVIDLCKNAES